MPHYTNPKRMWFTERGRLGIVEEGSSTTTDGVTTTIVSISEAKSLLIKGLSLPTHFPVGADANYALADTDEFQGPLDEIPTQFHEALVFKALQKGYELQLGKNPQMFNVASYYRKGFDDMVKEGIKYANNNRTTRYHIKGHEM